MSTRKLQIQAYEAQLALTHALHQEVQHVDEDSPMFPVWQEAHRILNEMLHAGYAPRRWGMGLAAFLETGDETPEQLEEYDSIEY